MKIKALLVDLSGTLHVGNTPTNGAADAIRALRAAGVTLRWLSNTSKESKRSLLDKMAKMNLDVREEELFTSLSAVASIVKSRNLRPLYLLTDSAKDDFPLPQPPFDSVVVGLAPERLDYQHLNEAFRLLSPEGDAKPASLIATHKALYFRSSDGGLSLGPGPFVSGLEEASGVRAEVVGKPEKAFFELALHSLSRDGIGQESWSNVGMVGDDMRQDVGVVPAQLGLKRFLVKTGKYRPGDEDKMADMDGGRPSWVGESFAAAARDILNS